jgi:hypothetical protein
MLLLFYPNILGCWRPKFSKFNSFHNRVEFGTILEGLRNFGGGVEPPKPPSVHHCSCKISDSHSGVAEDSNLLGCYTVHIATDVSKDREAFLFSAPDPQDIGTAFLRNAERGFFTLNRRLTSRRVNASVNVYSRQVMLLPRKTKKYMQYSRAPVI